MKTKLFKLARISRKTEMELGVNMERSPFQFGKQDLAGRTFKNKRSNITSLILCVHCKVEEMHPFQ